MQIYEVVNKLRGSQNPYMFTFVSKTTHSDIHGEDDKQMELTLRGIHKSFESNHVLKGFSAKNKAAFGLLGRNGSGKTTTLRIIMDIFSPDSGEVLIDGVGKSQSYVKIYN